MTEPYMAKGLDQKQLSQMAQEGGVNPRRYGWRGLLRRFAWVVCIGWCGMMLAGCSDFLGDVGDLFRIGGGGNAEAQTATEERVKTFTINTNEFEIVLDDQDDPTPYLGKAPDNGEESSNTTMLALDATMLTMRSEGIMVLGTGDTIRLEEGDIIILRLNGSTGSATLIRAD